MEAWPSATVRSPARLGRSARQVAATGADGAEGAEIAAEGGGVMGVVFFEPTGTDCFVESGLKDLQFGTDLRNACANV